MEAFEIPGKLLLNFRDEKGSLPGMELDLKLKGEWANSPETTLDFSEALKGFKREGKTKLRLRITVQANENGGPYSLLLRYEGGQHPETGHLKPGQKKSWEFNLLL